MKKTKIIGLCLIGLLAGCGPAKVMDIVEVKANETAWAIPLDGSSQLGQVKFNSIEFLNAKKIAAKRIMVDKVERSTGRAWYDYEWIPAVRVIKVDRSLVTREWTDSPETGTSTVKQGIGVVTKDSVQLRVGLTVTASIDEDDASTYLYYHGERTLSDVMDQNIRSFAVAELTKQYGDLTLVDAQTKGTLIYGTLFTDAKAAFKTKGITVQYLGNAEGLAYADPKVQEAINRSYQASQDAKTAEMEQNATKVRNQTIILTRLAEAQAEQGAQEVRNKVTVETAEAQATAAKALQAAAEAATFQNELQIKLLAAQAQMKWASNWDGKMPANILPENSPMLLNLNMRPQASTN
jgi:hypothetical protein